VSWVCSDGIKGLGCAETLACLKTFGAGFCNFARVLNDLFVPCGEAWHRVCRKRPERMVTAFSTSDAEISTKPSTATSVPLATAPLQVIASIIASTIPFCSLKIWCQRLAQLW